MTHQVATLPCCMPKTVPSIHQCRLQLDLRGGKKRHGCSMQMHIRFPGLTVQIEPRTAPSMHGKTSGQNCSQCVLRL